MADDLLSRLGALPQSAIRPAQQSPLQDRETQDSRRTSSSRAQNSDAQGYIPAAETLRTLTANALDAQSKGNYLDRGCILNIVV